MILIAITWTLVCLATKVGVYRNFWTAVYVLRYCVAIVVSSQCAGTTLTLTATSSPQYLNSPGWPSNYNNDLNCTWHIQGSNNAVIINVQAVTIESDADGCYDSLRVYAGASDAGATSHEFCTGNIPTRVFVSTDTTGDIFITFVTDFSIVDTGFQLLYFVTNSAYQPACDSTLTASTSELYLMTTSLPNQYAASVTCDYSISGPANHVIQINYYLIDFEDVTDCTNDKLVIRNGSDDRAALLQKLCSAGDVYNIPSIYSSDNTAFIRFQSNANTHHYGYFISYQAFTNTTTNCDMTLTATSESQTFITPNYPSNYDTNTDCFYSITSFHADYGVSVTATSFTLEYSTYCSYDYVALYDGSSTSASLLGKFCGTTFPGSTSSGQNIYVRFVTDYSVNYAGGSFNYVAVDTSYPNCKAGYTAYTAITTIQTFSSTGASYSNNVDEYFLVNTSSAGSLILELTAMDVENAAGCIYDRIIIYDGGCTRFDVLHTVCGRYLQRWELTGTEYLVHFHTDGSVTGTGFTMQYYLGVVSTGAPTTTTTTVGPPVAVEVNLVGEVLTNYSAENVPSRDLSSPVGSTVDVLFVGINDLDEVNQKLTSTMQFIINWKDDFLAWPPSKKGGITQLLIPQDDVWKPDFALVNGFDKITQMGASFMFVVVQYNGSCLWRPFQILESVCPVDMTSYPYDTQTCDIKFSTWASSANDVALTIGGSGIAKHERFVEHGEWELISITQRTDTENGKAVTVFSVTMKRNHNFTVFYMAIPVILLSYLCAFTFVVPLASGEKSGLAITVFLSFVVYIIVTFQKLPENSENLSYFAMYILVMTCVSGIEVMIVILELRMLTLNANKKPVVSCTRSITSGILRCQVRMFCLKQKTTVTDNDDTPSISRAKEGNKPWADFVSALDFICFWVYLFVVTATTIYFMLFLSS